MAHKDGYTPPPSVAHEIGVMFGFIGLMLLCMIVYGVAWQYNNKKIQMREVERIEKLKASGYLRREKESTEHPAFEGSEGPVQY